MHSSGGGGWTPSARLEPGRLLRSPTEGCFTPGRVTTNSPTSRVSLARAGSLAACCSRPKGADCIRQKSGVGERGSNSDYGGGCSNLFSVDDIGITVVSFFPHVHVHVKLSDMNRPELGRHECMCLAVRKMNRRKEGGKG